MSLRAPGLAALVVVASGLLRCDCGAPQPEGGSPLGDGFERVAALDERTVSLQFSRAIDGATLPGSSWSVVDYTVVPPADVGVSSTVAIGDAEVHVTTGDALVAGRTYTLTVTGLRDLDGYPVEGALNFVAQVGSQLTQVALRVDDVETARQWDELAVLATISPEDGAFEERLELFPLEDLGSHFGASLDVLVDPLRTLDPVDDGDPAVDRRPYAVRLVDGAGRMASPLVPFVVADAQALTVAVPVLPPPEIVVPQPDDPLPPAPEDPSPDDGKRAVLIAVDDRAAGQLADPALKVAFDDSGNFDSSFPRTVDLEPLDGSPGWWGAVVEVAVDPARTADGTSEATFPYFAILVEQGTEYENLSVAVTAPDETPATFRLSLGNPAWTPVTFRVDASQAYLTLDGSERGVRAGEAVFLTGEWQQAVDALGNNAGDAFSGGEQLNLKMDELSTHPGVWTRTLWLPPGRPYGWKVTRCDAATGCGPLNQLVASSGRAFATVMKNLATDNVDAFADPAVGLVDPVAPQATEAGGQTLDYSGAAVWQGNGVGSEPDPSGTPDGMRMFKQEVPDLVVVVGDDAIKTRVVHVGTWRDVNLGQTPAEILATSSVVELNPADYDDGMIGRFPPSREEP
jgi:hypothetical protein